MSKKTTGGDDVPSAFRKSDGPSPRLWESTLLSLSSNLYGLLVKEPYMCRFLKVVQREEHSWLAIAGSYDEDDLPIVCFGNGHSWASAMYSLAQSMSKNAWKGDKFAG